jgi:hypothetical protein
MEGRRWVQACKALRAIRSSRERSPIIPKNVPHSFLVPKGKHITYTLVKFPSE